MRRLLHRPLVVQVVLLCATLLCVALLSPVLRRGLERTQGMLSYPYADDGLEGTLVHEARLLKQGEPLYQPLQPERFVSAPYTPLHPILLSFADLERPHPFYAGRWLSLLPMLGAALVLAIFAAIHTRYVALGLLAAVLWLALPAPQLWATRVKPDALALMLSAIGLLVGSLRHGRYAHWALLPFVLAFLAKQTALTAPAALLLALCFTSWRRAGTMALVYAVVLAATWGALELWTGGLAGSHIWGLHRSEWWSAALMLKYVRLMEQLLPLLGLSILGLVTARASFALRAALCYMLLATLALYGAGETGAHHNHLLAPSLSWIMVGTLSIGLLVSRAGEILGRTWHLLAAAGALGLVLTQVLLLKTLPAWYGREFELRDQERFVALTRSQPGEVLADDIGLLVAADKPIRYDDPSTMGPAARSGVWSEAYLHRQIRQREFSAILLPLDLEAYPHDPSGRWTDQTLLLIREHYKVLYADTIFSYVPR